MCDLRQTPDAGQPFISKAWSLKLKMEALSYASLTPVFLRH